VAKVGTSNPDRKISARKLKIIIIIIIIIIIHLKLTFLKLIKYFRPGPKRWHAGRQPPNRN